MQDGGDVNWVVVYPPGRWQALTTPNKETVYFVVDHDNEREWKTNPQNWQISHLQVLFDG